MNWIHYLKYELFSVYYFRMSAKCGMIGIFIFFIFSTLVERDSNTGVFLWNLPNCLEHLLWTIPANDCYWISIANCQNTFLRFSTWSVFILLLRDPPNSMTRTCIFVSVSNWNWNSILFYIVYSLLKKLFSIKTRIILKSVKWLCKSIIFYTIRLFTELISHHYQSGYRKNHSTATLPAKLRDDIKEAMKASETTLAVFKDYLKHLILLTFLFWFGRCTHSTFLNVFYIGFLAI